MNQFEKLDLLLRECGGTIQTFQVLNNGISKSVFYAYVKERGLEQASHGVYVSPDTWTDAMYLLHLRCGQETDPFSKTDFRRTCPNWQRKSLLLKT